MDQHDTDDEAAGELPPADAWEITYRGLMRPRLAPDNQEEAVHAGRS